MLGAKAEFYLHFGVSEALSGASFSIPLGEGDCA